MIKCDSCTEMAIGSYTLADFPDKPSLLCAAHGQQYGTDANAYNMVWTMVPIKQHQPA